MGIVVYPEKAKRSPCKCIIIEHTGERLCWVPGIIGTLSDEQEEIFCNPKEKEVWVLYEVVYKPKVREILLRKKKERIKEFPPIQGRSDLKRFLDKLRKEEEKIYKEFLRK